MYKHTMILDRQSVLHITAPVQRKFDMLVEDVGKLEKRSVPLLLDLYRALNFGV